MDVLTTPHLHLFHFQVRPLILIFSLHKIRTVHWNIHSMGYSFIHSYIIDIVFRGSRPGMFLGKGILKICSKFTGEHPCRSAISVTFTPFLKNTFGWLLLCFQNRLQHPCSSAGFFSKVKLWKVVIRYKC